MAIEGKTSVFTRTYDTAKVGQVLATVQHADYTLATGYTPAEYDVVARDPGDSNKYVKFDASDATHVVLGIIATYDSDKNVIEMIDTARDVVLSKVGIDNLAGNINAAKDAMREKGLYTI